MFDLNPSSEMPLNEQIVEKTKIMIAKGILRDGDSMPSVRDLSKNLLINQSTVQKAYNKLKEDGLLISKPGLGTFVSINKEKIEHEKEILLKQLYKIFLKSKLYNIGFDEIKRVYEKTGENI